MLRQNSSWLMFLLLNISRAGQGGQLFMWGNMRVDFCREQGAETGALNMIHNSASIGQLISCPFLSKGELISKNKFYLQHIYHILINWVSC